MRLLLVRRDKWLSGVESLFYQFLVVGFLPVFPAFENLPISREEMDTLDLTNKKIVRGILAYSVLLKIDTEVFF